MKEFRSHLLAVCGLAFMVAAIALVESRPAAGQRDVPPGVVVTTTSDSPVLTRVITCPDQNCPTVVLNLNDRHAVHYQNKVDLDDNHSGGSRQETITLVPAGKRLIIEYVSVHGSLNGGKVRHLAVTMTLNNKTVDYHLLALAQLTYANGGRSFVVNQQVRLYADPGTRVFAYFARNDGTTSGKAYFAISGYLVDL